MLRSGTTQERRELTLWTRPSSRQPAVDTVSSSGASFQKPVHTIPPVPEPEAVIKMPEVIEVAQVADPVTPSPEPTVTSPARVKTKKTATDTDDTKLNVQLDRPQIKLYPSFQTDLYYRICPIFHRLQTHEEANRGRTPADFASNKNAFEGIDLNSALIEGPSGSGLTTLLARKAYDNYQDDRPTIILTHRNFMQDKIAQAIVDHSENDPTTRQAVADSIELINGERSLAHANPKKKIYIISVDTLVKYLEENSEYQAQLQAQSLGYVWKQPHRFLADVLPLERINDIFVDEINSYTGYANKGYTKALNALLAESAKHSYRGSVNLLGTTSNRVLRAQEPREGHRSLELDDYIPPIARVQAPNPQDLRDLDHYKNISIVPIELDPETQAEIVYADRRGKLKDASPRGINANIVRLYQEANTREPGKRWHIIADSRDHADQLCALFNLEGVKARALTSTTQGYFRKPEGSEQWNFLLNDSKDQASKTKLVKVNSPSRKGYQEIVADYESGECPVIIDIDFDSCFHSTATDRVIVAHLRHDDDIHSPSTHHYLGEAVRGVGSSPDIKYYFLATNPREQFEKYLELKPGQTLIRPKSQSSTSASYDSTHIPLDANLTLGKEHKQKVHPEWYRHGLSLILTNPGYKDLDFNEAINKLTQEFKSSKVRFESVEELAAVISGQNKNPELFGAFIQFAEPLLGQDLLQVSSYAPELTGVPNIEVANNIIKRHYDNLTDELRSENEAWLKILDDALKIHDQVPEGQRPLLRSQYFAKIIEGKFGLEHFKNRSGIREMVAIFSGQSINYRVFGLLINSLGLSFDDMRKHFPELTGSAVALPFEELKKILIKKYPEGPLTNQTLDRFFREQIYDDTNIDLGTIVSSVADYGRAVEQPVIDGTVRAEIQNFLEDIYRVRAIEDNPSTVESHTATRQQEIQAKVEEHLSLVTREILYNQLFAQIWGIQRNTRSYGQDLILDMAAHQIQVSERGLGNKSLVDLTKVHGAWTTRLDAHVHPGHYHIDLRERLATLAVKFIAHKFDVPTIVNESKESNKDYTYFSGAVRNRMSIMDDQFNAVSLSRDLNTTEQRALEVILGQIPGSELNPDERLLMREFAEFHGLKPNDLLAEFYPFLGVNNINEAQKIINQRIKSLNIAIDPAWQANFGDRDEFVRLLAGFILEEESDLFQNPNNLLDTYLRATSGDIDPEYKAESKKFNRRFIAYANTHGKSLDELQMVINHHKLLGIKDKDELFAVTRKIRTINSNTGLDPNSSTSPSASIHFVELLAIDLDISSDEIFALAQIKDPQTFYRKPIRLASRHIGHKIDYTNKQREAIGTQLKALPENKNSAIKAKLFMRAVWGDAYKHPAKFIVPENAKALRVTTTLDNASVTVDEEREASTNKWEVHDRQKYSFDGSDWILESATTTPACVRTKKLFPKKERIPDAWTQNLEKLARIAFPSSSDSTIIAIDTFLRERAQQDRSILDDDSCLRRLINICLGDPQLFPNSNYGEAQAIFRDFSSFIYQRAGEACDTSQLISAFPRLMGIKDYEELRTSIKTLYPTWQSLVNDIPKLEEIRSKDLNAANSKIFSKLQERLSLDRSSILKLANSDEIIDRYSGEVKDLCTNFRLTGNIEKMRNEGISSLHLWRDLWDDQYPDYSVQSMFPNPERGASIYVAHNIIQVDLVSLKTRKDPPPHIGHVRSVYNPNTKAWERRFLDEKELTIRNVMLAPYAVTKSYNQELDKLFCSEINQNRFDQLNTQLGILITRFISDRYPSALEAGSEDRLRALVSAILGVPQTFATDRALAIEATEAFVDYITQQYPNLEAARQIYRDIATQSQSFSATGLDLSSLRASGHERLDKDAQQVKQRGARWVLGSIIQDQCMAQGIRFHFSMIDTIRAEFGSVTDPQAHISGAWSLIKGKIPQGLVARMPTLIDQQKSDICDIDLLNKLFDCYAFITEIDLGKDKRGNDYCLGYTNDQITVLKTTPKRRAHILGTFSKSNDTWAKRDLRADLEAVRAQVPANYKAADPSDLKKDIQEWCKAANVNFDQLWRSINPVEEFQPLVNLTGPIGNPGKHLQNNIEIIRALLLYYKIHPNASRVFNFDINQNQILQIGIDSGKLHCNFSNFKAVQDHGLWRIVTVTNPDNSLSTVQLPARELPAIYSLDDIDLWFDRMEEEGIKNAEASNILVNYLTQFTGLSQEELYREFKVTENMGAHYQRILNSITAQLSKSGAKISGSITIDDSSITMGQRYMLLSAIWPEFTRSNFTAQVKAPDNSQALATIQISGDKVSVQTPEELGLFLFNRDNQKWEQVS